MQPLLFFPIPFFQPWRGHHASRLAGLSRVYAPCPGLMINSLPSLPRGSRFASPGKTQVGLDKSAGPELRPSPSFRSVRSFPGLASWASGERSALCWRYRFVTYTLGASGGRVEEVCPESRGECVRTQRKTELRGRETAERERGRERGPVLGPQAPTPSTRPCWNPQAPRAVNR